MVPSGMLDEKDKGLSIKLVTNGGSHGFGQAKFRGMRETQAS